MKPIVQIVPFLNERSGIADYAQGLAGRLRARGLENRVTAVKEAAGFAGESPRILLHYSGYGFQKRGVPWSLPGVLQRFRAARIIVYFHETWASSSPLHSPFYLRFLQRLIVKRLGSLALACVTSTPRMRREIEQLTGKPVEVLPIPGLSEPGTPPLNNFAEPWSPLVFGLPESRRRATAAHAVFLKNLQRKSLLREMVVAGAAGGSCAETELADIRADFPGMAVRHLGEVPKERVEAIFSGASFLLTHYPSDLLAKSSVAMTAFACGLPVVVGSETAATESPPVGTYLSSVQLEKNGSECLKQTASRAFDWYRQSAGWDRTVDYCERVFDAG